MVETTDMAERHGRMLARFQALGADLAELFHDGAMAAETPEAAERQGRAFHRACRCARQSMALEARFFRDLARKDREDRDEARLEQAEALAKRKARVRLGVERLIWTEAEGADAIDLGARLDDLLEEAELSETLADGPIEAVIERLCKDLGVSAEALHAAETPPAPDPKSAPRPFSNLHDDPWKDWRSG